MTEEQKHEDPIRKMIYNCAHEARNIATCEHCRPVLRMIQTNTRLMNLRHIFMKMLKGLDMNYIDYVEDLSEDEERLVEELLREARSWEPG